jgi:high-affinity nickel permease
VSELWQGAGVPVVAALSLAALLGLRHAADLDHLLARGHRSSTYIERAVPLFGVLSLAVGVWYALVALGLLRL